VTRPEELHFLTVAAAGRLIRDGALAPSRYVGAMIDRVRQLDPMLRCTITLAAETALADAQSAELELGRGDWRGPLHGIPIGIKDCIATAGIRTTANSRLFTDWVPAEDAPSVTALRAAGAIVLAKLNLNELAWSIPAEDDLHPPPRNPWSREHYAMGSSSGSAVAVAAGLCPAALGTDAGGSVRQPAANCGVVGLKPTHGLIDSAGALGPRTICEVGPITRSVEDAALLLGGLVGRRQSYVDGIGRLPARSRVGIPRRHIELAEADPEIAAAFVEVTHVLADLGMEIVEVDVEGLADAAAANFVVLNAEAFAAHEATLRSRMQMYGSSARLYHVQGAFLSAADYIAARAVGQIAQHQVDEALTAVDVLATPVVPFLTAEAARSAKAQPHTGGGAIFTAPFNLTGHPALALPCGRSAEGIPIGLQLVGRRDGDAELLRFGHAYEQATRWHTMNPSLDAA